MDEVPSFKVTCLIFLNIFFKMEIPSNDLDRIHKSPFEPRRRVNTSSSLPVSNRLSSTTNDSKKNSTASLDEKQNLKNANLISNPTVILVKSLLSPEVSTLETLEYERYITQFSSSSQSYPGGHGAEDEDEDEKYEYEY